MNEENTQTLLNTGKQLAGVHDITPDGKSAPVLFDGEGCPHVLPFDEVEAWLQFPTRKRGNHSFADADSFIRFFNIHKEDGSIVLAKITDTAAHFIGIINCAVKSGPDWADFQCAFGLQPTKEWQVWTGYNQKNMGQAEFALFLENNSDMFKEPSGADLLELVLTLEAKSNASIKSAIRLPNGQLNVAVSEEITLRGNTSNQESTIELPTVLKVSLMPFQGTGVYDLSARLRYRVQDRKISFWYETINAHLVLRQVASDVLLQIEKATGVQPFKV